MELLRGVIRPAPSRAVLALGCRGAEPAEQRGLVAINVSPELASGDALPRCALRTGTAAKAAEISKEKGWRYRTPAAVWATAPWDALQLSWGYLVGDIFE